MQNTCLKTTNAYEDLVSLVKENLRTKRLRFLDLSGFDRHTLQKFILFGARLPLPVEQRYWFNKEDQRLYFNFP